MPAEALIEKINKKSAAECDAILKAAKSKADEIISSALFKAEEQADKLLSDADNKVAKTETESAQNIELQLNILKLKKKHELLRQAHRTAKERLMSLPNDKWSELITMLVLKNSPCGNIEIQVPASDKDRYLNPDFYKSVSGKDEKTAFVDVLGAALTEKHGKQCTVSVRDGFADFDGGFTLFSENYDVDLSFDAILDDIFDDNIIEISNCLFNDGHGESV